MMHSCDYTQSTNWAMVTKSGDDGFSWLARTFGEVLTILSTPALFVVVVEISLHTPIPL